MAAVVPPDTAVGVVLVVLVVVVDVPVVDEKVDSTVLTINVVMSVTAIFAKQLIR